MNKPKSNEMLFYAIASILMGILLIVGGVDAASGIMAVIITILGVVTIILGVSTIFSGAVVVGIVEIVIGALLITFAWTVAWIAFIIYGAALIIYGIAALFRREGWVVANIWNVLVGIMIILVACGVNWSWKVANVFFWISGGLMVVEGIVLLIWNFKKN